mmetsp:Transcript_41475/g.109424  ORF Transcript_41475/g.109424 Transcript_41475/m.109424 type:complete len:277 (-) Transcript_41475:350-1180(-)
MSFPARGGARQRSHISEGQSSFVAASAAEGALEVSQLHPEPRLLELLDEAIHIGPLRVVAHHHLRAAFAEIAHGVHLRSYLHQLQVEAHAELLHVSIVGINRKARDVELHHLPMHGVLRLLVELVVVHGRLQVRLVDLRAGRGHGGLQLLRVVVRHRLELLWRLPRGAGPAEDASLMQLAALPQVRCLRPLPDLPVEQLGLAISPVLVDDDLVLRVALVLAAPSRQITLVLLRLPLMRASPEEVTVVRVVPPLLVAQQLLPLRLPAGRHVGVEHLR